ncbi:hypothetical protein K504DRAFT_532028 [Pleomassaria siparia CBS 279.74]|uniref:Transcription factor IIIC putative zinc-finger domain-containing protein n=1 Tax=Pleomassaria siparia CBS 279.74 TaxID=1314801 RepID=A0A6G1KF86_9PLEO|nr:hypothetical protein K504DRAFT_532028 [Pleomassaria siparia CBS 279.74]
MRDVTELRCWPSCLHAIDWSHDGIIALASDEQVDLLFPKIWYQDAQEDILPPRTFPLQVPWFTKEELPFKENAPNHTLSTGEEISSSHPACISWSPPGLAKHRRCALAALTSNLVLSIWSSDAKLRDDLSWERRLIINDVLSDYFLSARDAGCSLVTEFEETHRLRKRVRAFAWAPSMYDGQSAGTMGTHLVWGQFLVAVTNDDNQVVVLNVNSPTSTLGVSETWTADVVNHFTVTPDTGSAVSDPDLFEEIMQQQRHLPHIAWSPWAEIKTSVHSVLAYATNQDVRARVIVHSSGSTEFGPEVVYPDIDIQYAGPMRWLPKVEGHTLKLLLFTNVEVVCLTISILDASVLQKATRHLDGRWDSISGVAFDIQHESCTQMHFSSFKSTYSYPTALLELSDAGLTVPAIAPAWYQDINGYNTNFSVEHDLRGNVYTKMWGLSTSPLGDFLASCHAVHPSDEFEYGPPAYRHTKVTIRAMDSSDGLSFIARNVSAEGIMFSVKNWIEDHDEQNEPLPVAQDRIKKQLLDVYGGPNKQSDGDGASIDAYMSTDIWTVLTAFKKNVFLDRNTLKDRYDILLSIIFTPSASTDLSRFMIAFRLATALQTLPPHLAAITVCSKSILVQSRQVLRFIQDLSSDTDTTYSQSETIETCGFCGALIPFTSLTTAACTNGHQFLRCGLSFLAIQLPGVTKHCGICNTPFLSDEFVIEHEEIVKMAPSTPEQTGSDGEGDGGSVQPDVETDITPEETVASTEPQVEETQEIEYTVEPSPTLEEEEEEEENSIVPESPKPTTPRTGTPADEADMIDGSEELSESTAIAIRDETNERRTPMVPQKDAGRELPLSLARVLFLACDACIYCGGKYSG